MIPKSDRVFDTEKTVCAIHCRDGWWVTVDFDSFVSSYRFSDDEAHYTLGDRDDDVWFQPYSPTNVFGDRASAIGECRRRNEHAFVVEES